MQAYLNSSLVILDLFEIEGPLHCCHISENFLLASASEANLRGQSGCQKIGDRAVTQESEKTLYINRH